MPPTSRSALRVLALLASAAGLFSRLQAEMLKGGDLGDGAPRPARVTGLEPIKPIPLGPKLDEAKVALGRSLFADPRLSRDGSISCASCHDLKRGGADSRRYSVGVGGAVVALNTPTVFNSGLNFKQFWDGRVRTLEEQIDGPLESPEEMGSQWPEVVAKLRRVPDYVQRFRDLYAEGVTRENIKDALATFERSLLTPNARFDRFLRGDEGALNAVEKRGYAKFKSYGCASCHQGVNVGGNMFQTMGAMEDYFAARGKITKADLGRFNVTGREEDRYVFKVPSLRNVALTAPYFHDGSQARLEDAVKEMAELQLGQALSPEDIAELVSFLQTLTGETGGTER